MAGQPLASPRCLFMLLGRRGHPQLVFDPLRAAGQAEHSTRTSASAMILPLSSKYMSPLT